MRGIMLSPSVDNPFLTKSRGTTLAAQEETISNDNSAPIDFSATNPVDEDRDIYNPDALPLVDKSRLKDNENKGLTIETTAKPTLDVQTRKWFHLTQAQWDALSDEEKQEKTQIALKGMVDAYNKHQEEIGSKKRLSYAEQVKLHRDRLPAGAYGEVERLTGSVKGLHGKDQADALKVAYQYKDAGNRNRAENTIAKDYTEYDKENVLVAAKETANFSQDNQAIAANQAYRADASQHKDLVHEFMTRDNEEVQTALAENVGKYGFNDGNITEEGKQIQYDCFKEIISSKYDSVVTTAAENVYNMDKSNQVFAVKDIYAMDNQEAKNAIASHYNDFDDSVKENIGDIINNSDCESSKEILEDAQTPSGNNESTVADETSPSTSDEIDTTLKSMEIDDILASNSTQNQAQIEKVLSNTPDSVKLRLLDGNPSKEVVMAMLDSNPSSDVMSKIIELLNNGNLSDKDQTELMSKVSAQGVFEGPNSKLGTLSPQMQTAYVKSLAPDKLNDIDKNALEKNARDVLETRLAENEKQQPVKKFGLLTAA